MSKNKIFNKKIGLRFSVGVGILIGFGLFFSIIYAQQTAPEEYICCHALISGEVEQCPGFKMSLEECQSYLARWEKGWRPSITDIEFLNEKPNYSYVNVGIYAIIGIIIAIILFILIRSFRRKKPK